MVTRAIFQCDRCHAEHTIDKPCQRDERFHIAVSDMGCDSLEHCDLCADCRAALHTFLAAVPLDVVKAER